jgi:hypothetical protein
MQKTILFAMMLFFLYFSNTNISISRPQYVQVKITVVNHWWARYFPALYVDKCGGTGDDCLVIVVKIEPVAVGINDGPGSGTHLDILIGDIEHENTVINEPSESGIVYPSNINYTFPPDSFARITDSDDPTWIGLQWEISGQTTDGSGKIYKYFPF